MNIFHRLFFFFFIFIFSSTTFAQDLPVRVVGTKPTTVHPTVVHGKLTKATALPNKTILLQKIVLSQEARQNIIESLEQPQQITFTSSLPNEITLGMNNVPVLDQGAHGACVTFASTALLDAVTGKGDYISQLCNLALGVYLHKRDSNYDSGWDGSYNARVLSQIQTYGILSKDYQETAGCGGLKEYPLDDPYTTSDSISIHKFTTHSEMMMSGMSMVRHLKMQNAFTKKVNMEQVFQQVKTALLNQHRVLIGFLLDDNGGTPGAFGRYQVENDSWILTPDILTHFRKDKINAGHAIIVTGYNDDAEIEGPDHLKHKGIFILRNSWNDTSGDHGDYYMSYDYFKTLVSEVIEVLPA